MYATTLTRSLNCRYLDDVFVVDLMPSEDDYGMKYAVSSEGLDVVYVGMRIYVKDGATRTTLYDRDEEYPFHILRYPHTGSIASDAQRHNNGTLCCRSTILLYYVGSEAINSVDPT